MLTRKTNEPARAEHLRPGRLASSPQFTVGGDHDAPAGQLPHQGHDRVIAGPLGLDDPHVRTRVVLGGFDPGGRGPGGTLQDHDELFGLVLIGQDGAAPGGQGGEFGVQPDRRAGPVPPPAVGARPHDVGDIHDNRGPGGRLCWPGRLWQRAQTPQSWRGLMMADPVLLRTVS
jgi:hypothetical protein